MRLQIQIYLIALASYSGHSLASLLPNAIEQRQSLPDTASLPSWSQRNLNTIETIYNLTIFPHNVPILQHGAEAVPPGLFNENATGRISPLGNFTGFEDSIEYFFALAPTPQGSGGKATYKADIVSFTSGCPEVASSLVYLHAGTVNNVTGAPDLTKPTTTLSQVAFWRFDDQGRVLQYQAWIPELARWIKATQDIQISNRHVQEDTILKLCPVIQQHCTGENQQYSSTLECIQTLESKPYGTFDEVWGDNIVCRTIHLILTEVRPKVHCPHVGPFGGSAPNNYKCVDINYDQEYFNDDYLFGGQYDFTCKIANFTGL